MKINNILNQLSMDKINLNNEQWKAFKVMEDTYENLFITGKAGTGKSALLTYFLRHTKKDVVVLAPTGVAALNIGGQTIHSFFGLAPGLQNPEDIEAIHRRPRGTVEVIKNLDAIIIDEISMVSSDVMNMIDAKLRFIRGNKMPFGGVHMLVFGDLYQLPPVMTDSDQRRFVLDRFGSEYFFNADALRERPFRMVELSHIFRQSDAEFIEMLNAIRLGQADDDVLEALNERCYIDDDDDCITLTATNARANDVNRARMRGLKTPLFKHIGTVTGVMNRSDLPTDVRLELKEGAHIMMVKNDHIVAKDKAKGVQGHGIRWVNGSLGQVSFTDDRHDKVRVKIGRNDYNVDLETWEKRQYRYDRQAGKIDGKVVGEFNQFPIKLAYAITIHKAQGQTYDAARIDMGRGAFSEGQTYVALSRCRSLDRLYLTRPIQADDIIVSEVVNRFMNSGGTEVPRPSLLFV